MGIDLILHSNNISSESTLQRPKWNVDNRIPSGKLSIKSFNYENHPNTDWVLMDHINPQTHSTSWFSRDDALNYTNVSVTAIGSESDLTQRYRRAGTFEGAVPGYNEIKIQTVNTNFEGTTDRAYWIFSKETRDAFGRQSEAGEDGTLTVGKEDSFLFNKFPLIDSWDFNTSDQAKSFYVDPNFVPSTPASGPFIVSHQHVDGNIQCFYLENGNGGTANSNTSVGNLLYYGIQIWIRRYVPKYNPYAIIHQNVGARDYRTGDIQNKTPVKFMYFQLFNPNSVSSSLSITEVRLLDTAQNNVLQDSSILVPTDGLNSLAVETNPSCTDIKSGDTLADIIDNSILSNARIGNIADDIDEIIQFKLNREYTFDEFSRLEVYFNNKNAPFQIRFLNADYELVHTSVFYTSKPTFTGTDESLIVLKFLGPPNVMEGFTNSVNDDVVVYVYNWADELVLSSSYIYRKELEIPFNLGVGGVPARIKRPIQPTSIGAIISNKDSPYTNFNIPSISDDPTAPTGTYGWKLIDHIPVGDTGTWWSREDDLGFREDNPPTGTGSVTNLTQRFTDGRSMSEICPGYDQILLKTINTYDGTLGGQAGDLFYVISRAERDRMAQIEGNGNLSLLASYDGDTSLHFRMFQSEILRPYISFPSFSTTSVLYQENNDNGRKGLIPFGLQIWIRNSKSGNVTTKGSCVPIRPLDGVQWHNNGEIEFSLEKLSTREQISNDETPKDYSLHCHICTCSRGP